jgi:hypothetical protein
MGKLSSQRKGKLDYAWVMTYVYSITEETQWSQLGSMWHVEFRDTAVGTCNKRSAFCWSVTDGGWHEGM